MQIMHLQCTVYARSMHGQCMLCVAATSSRSSGASCSHFFPMPNHPRPAAAAPAVLPMGELLSIELPMIEAAGIRRLVLNTCTQKKSRRSRQNWSRFVPLGCLDATRGVHDFIGSRSSRVLAASFRISVCLLAETSRLALPRRGALLHEPASDAVRD